MEEQGKVVINENSISAESMLRSFALEESINGVAFANEVGVLSYVNKSFLKLWRLKDATEILGKSAFSLFKSPNETQKVISLVLTKGAWDGEITAIRHDNSEFIVKFSAKMLNDGNSPATLVASFVDITDRKNFESQLLQSNLRLAQIEQFVDLTTDTVLVTNEQGYLVYINKAASERLGIPQQECTDFNILDFEVLFKERANWSTFVEGLKKIDSIKGERVYFNKKTGEVFPAGVTARHVIIQDKGYTIAIARDISEQKKGEEELRESRERLAEAQRISKLGYWEQNLITNTIWWSDMQYEIFGLSKSETPKTNDDFVKLIHPEDHKKFIKILNGKLSDSVENYRIVRPDGEVRVVHAVAQITYNERGVPIKLSGVNQDITERIKVDNALRESELTLRRAQRIAKIGSWKLDVESNVMEWSEETFKIFNVPMDNRPLTPYEHFYEHVHPEDKDYVYNSWRAAIDNKAAKYEIIHRIIVDNTIKWVSEQTEFTYEYQKLVRVFGTIQDITDQMFLRDANVIFNQSQSLAGIGSWRLSIKSRELFWSDSVYSLFGIDKETTVATHEVYLNAIYHEDRPRVIAESKETHGKNATFDIEYRVQLPSGELRWIYEKGNLLVDNNGVPIEMYGIVREITSEKNKTEELIKARSQAEEASTVKDEFLSVMSHEIRTPLNSVIGLSNLLLRRSPREDQLAIMKTLKGSADNLMHLVNDVLDYNKIRAGKLELEAIPFSLNKFLQHLHATFSVSAQDKGLDFLIHEDPRVPDELIGDVGRLNQIFNNLLNNAVKFTNLGYVKLEVQLKTTSADFCTILFQVMDTGVGIPADKLNSVFMPFQQSERSTSRIYGGTGLGLSIVKTLVDIMGGKLNLSSKEEVGTVFNLEFDFPFSSVEVSNEQLPEQNVVIPRKEDVRTKKLKILYVEDVESNRFLIKNLLSDFNINCQTASSGQAALRLTNKSKYDIILMDIQMPKMDGYQATERIRKQVGGKNCKTNIIAFTAEPYSEGLKQKIASHKIQDVVTKPFDTNKLIDKINQLTEASAQFFSFSFYERAFGEDPKQLKLIKRTVIKDLKKFEVGLLKYHPTGNLKGIRAEVHKMRPIMKNLECYALYEILDQYKWPEEEYTREAAAKLKEIVKLTKQLLQKIEKLKF